MNLTTCTKNVRGMKLALVAIVACACIGASSAHAAVIGHWTFDEGSGTAAADSSGNGYDATQGSAAGGWIAGKAGNAYNLPRFMLDAPDSVAVKNGGGSTVTLSVWMTVSTVTNNFQGIAGFESTGNAQDVYSLKMDNTDKIVWTVDGSSSFASADTLTNYAAATGDGWVHVVGVYEQGVGSTLYVNGAVAGTGAAANAIQSDISTFGIGSYQGGGSWVFSGSIDDVQVYHQALSSSDMALLGANPGLDLDAIAAIPAPAALPAGLALLGLAAMRRRRMK